MLSLRVAPNTMMMNMMKRIRGRLLSRNAIRAVDETSAKALADAVLEGDRTSLARAITLAEATGPRESLARAMLERVGDGAMAREKPGGKPTLRLAVTGPPGAGKSTLIDAVGPEFISRGRKVAVLAIDPSSKRTGGSILGDKTRMVRLSADHANAYVRASPSRCALGGIARHTGDAIALCEAAGYDTIIVETVGVGQSETGADDVADMFALVIGPAGGDELQVLKRGITEQVACERKKERKKERKRNRDKSSLL